MEINNLAVDILITSISIIVGFLGGYFAVYAFNKFPEGWFCDYGEKPDQKLIAKEAKRIRSYPWKPALAMVFIVICIKLGIEDWQFAIPAVIAIWILVQIIMADRLYMIIPDQFIILLAVTGFGFIPFFDNFLEPVWGALLGPVSYTHLRAHETRHDLVCRLLLEKKKTQTKPTILNL